MVFSKSSIGSSWISALIVAFLALLTGSGILWVLAGLLVALAGLKSLPGWLPFMRK